MWLRNLIASLYAIFLVLLLISGGSPTKKVVLVKWAGASFPYPLYMTWIKEYSRVNPGAIIDYQSVGSGAGIRLLNEGKIDFAASDMPLYDERYLVIPSVTGAVVLAYNLPFDKLKLTPDLIADIFMGRIKRWDDPRIAELNPGLKGDITVVHRSDGSGTTYIFTSYLSAISEEWNRTVGRGLVVGWPVGVGGKGNEGVAAVIMQTEGSIGYVEYTYAVQARLKTAVIRNKAGNFVEANETTVKAAISSFIKELRADPRAPIINSGAANAYPICSNTYIVIPKELRGEKGKAILDFLKWAVKHGQAFASPLGYVPLPEELVEIDERLLEGIKWTP
ncbi:MAG: phosphate ABC transporter substrate-binding protein PstS [Candidatus Methanodesulfokora sp.]